MKTADAAQRPADTSDHHLVGVHRLHSICHLFLSDLHPKGVFGGCSVGWRRVLADAFKIKIPLLKDVLITLFIFNAIGAIQVFNEPWMLGGLVVLPNNYTPAIHLFFGFFTRPVYTCGSHGNDLSVCDLCVFSVECSELRLNSS